MQALRNVWFTIGTGLSIHGFAGGHTGRAQAGTQTQDNTHVFLVESFRNLANTFKRCLGTKLTYLMDIFVVRDKLSLKPRGKQYGSLGPQTALTSDPSAEFRGPKATLSLNDSLEDLQNSLKAVQLMVVSLLQQKHTD